MISLFSIMTKFVQIFWSNAKDAKNFNVQETNFRLICFSAQNLNTNVLIVSNSSNGSFWKPMTASLSSMMSIRKFSSIPYLKTPFWEIYRAKIWHSGIITNRQSFKSSNRISISSSSIQLWVRKTYWKFRVMARTFAESVTVVAAIWCVLIARTIYACHAENSAGNASIRRNSFNKTLVNNQRMSLHSRVLVERERKNRILKILITHLINARLSAFTKSRWLLICVLAV